MGEVGEGVRDQGTGRRGVEGLGNSPGSKGPGG